MGFTLPGENLENQAFTSQNHNLGQESDTNVKLAVILITLWLQKVSKCFSCCIFNFGWSPHICCIQTLAILKDSVLVIDEVFSYVIGGYVPLYATAN